jgi:hypothetical protein
MSAPFRLNRNGLLLALISAAFAGEAGAMAGRVDFISGNVTVSGTDGLQRPLARGVELDTGDTVRTGDGRAQIRFTDGAYVSLQPNTEFAIKDYNFEGKTDGSERGFFALAKGAMRTVSGLVGRVNRNRYQITTPTATIGIRGTGGVIQVLNDGSTLVIGTSGIWSLTNPVGSIDIPAGVSAVAPSAPNSPPQQTSQAPQSGPAPVPQQALFTQGDQRDPSGNPAGITKPLVSGGGYAAAVAFSWNASPKVQSNGNVTATFDSANQLTSLTYSDGQVFKYDPANGPLAESFNTDGILAWGRWTKHVSGLANIDGLLTVNETYSANQGLHYVVGTPTPVMPTGGSATYSLLGATQPTYVDGRVGPGSFTGKLDVSFGPVATINGNFNIAMPDGKGFALTSSGTTNTAMFSLSTSVSGSGGSCLSGCSAGVQGFFAGPSAERAGIGYRVTDSLGGQVVGAAAFKK